MITVVADCPTNNAEMVKVQELSSKIGPLPDGVELVADNVWLVDQEVAINFLLVLGEIAAQVGQKVRAYSTVPKRPA
jgi:hypothetical protein